MSKLKNFLLVIWDWCYIERQWHKILTKNKLNIMGSQKTIEQIKKSNCSVARFGDGEFDLMYKGRDLNFQTFSKEMSESLIHVLDNSSENLLICMPYPMISSKGMKKNGKRFWKLWTIENYEMISRNIIEKTGEKYCFGDSFVSRPYSGYRSKKYSKKIFTLLKEIWEDKDILIVEGSKTRLGVGNDLFDKAKSIKRIITSSEDAFSSYSTIFQTILDVWNGELVIMAVGPTATILASDLSKHNIQALDLGHVDIQYEWFLSGNDFKQVEGKYTNEAKEKTRIIECMDAKYLSQIVVDLSDN